MLKLNKLLCGLALLCLFGNEIQAQLANGSLKGIITDARTHETMPFANVILRDTLNTIVTGVAADLEGNYTIKKVPPGRYLVEVSFTGYHLTRRKVVIASGEKTEQNLEMWVKGSFVEVPVTKLRDHVWDLAGMVTGIAAFFALVFLTK